MQADTVQPDVTEQAGEPERALARPPSADLEDGARGTPEADLELEAIRDALKDVTGKEILSGDRLPGELLARGKEQGADAVSLARWIRDMGVKKRQGRDPIRSNGFFLTVLKSELPAWLRLKQAPSMVVHGPAPPPEDFMRRQEQQAIEDAQRQLADPGLPEKERRSYLQVIQLLTSGDSAGHSVEIN